MTDPKVLDGFDALIANNPGTPTWRVVSSDLRSLIAAAIRAG